MRKSFVLIVFTVTILMGCQPEIKSPCVYGNFGVVEVHFTDATVRHKITVGTKTTHKERSYEIGTLSDTLWLRPNSYSSIMGSYNEDGTAINTIPRTITVTSCTTMSLTVDN